MGTQSNHTHGSINKSMVLDAKPLRCLVPTFQNPPHTFAPPSGYSPFYPFQTPISQYQPPQSDPTIPSPVPISSFRAPNAHPNQPYFPEEDYSENQSDQPFDEKYGENSGKGRKKGRPKSRNNDNFTPLDPEFDAAVDDFMKSFPITGPNAYPQSDGNKESVRLIIVTFDLLRRRISLDDSKGSRPDLRAGTVLMNKGAKTNSRKRIGGVPGVEIGDIFFFRFELCLVGLHAPIMAGIDYITQRSNLDEDPLAVSIVSSGSYEDNDEDGEILIYSGQGGVNGKNVSDQKLERGNLALENSLRRASEVRVIRGVRDVLYPTGKVYIYDGIYKVQESWMEKGKSGCNVFKYKLFRNPGQPEAFNLWKKIQHWKGNIESRVGLIQLDISSGSETLPIRLVNEIDDTRGFPQFTYVMSLKNPRKISSEESSMSCPCRGGCQQGDLNCPCMQKNGGFLAYTSIGVLLNYKNVIYECGSSCLCPQNCRNRVSQGGVKIRLEVFKTKNKGWGLRSWDPIRAGAYICEYAGEVIDKDNGDEYVLDTTRNFESLKSMPGYADVAPETPCPLVISSKNYGNVARFMNHSCFPNVYWQPIVREDERDLYVYIAFFAICHIAPLEELTFDYGTIQPGRTEQWKKKCLCELPSCRGHFC